MQTRVDLRKTGVSLAYQSLMSNVHYWGDFDEGDDDRRHQMRSPPRRFGKFPLRRLTQLGGGGSRHRLGQKPCSLPSCSSPPLGYIAFVQCILPPHATHCSPRNVSYACQTRFQHQSPFAGHLIPTQHSPSPKRYCAEAAWMPAAPLEKVLVEARNAVKQRRPC